MFNSGILYSTLKTIQEKVKDNINHVHLEPLSNKRYKDQSLEYATVVII